MDLQLTAVQTIGLCAAPYNWSEDSECGHSFRIEKSTLNSKHLTGELHRDPLWESPAPSGASLVDEKDEDRS